MNALLLFLLPPWLRSMVYISASWMAEVGGVGSVYLCPLMAEVGGVGGLYFCPSWLRLVVWGCACCVLWEFYLVFSKLKEFT